MDRELRAGKNEARLIEIEGGVAVEISLTQGQTTLVSLNDWELVRHHRWQAANSRGKHYASSHKRRGKGSFQLFMHRLLLGVTDLDVEVDHRSNDGLDNRRNNLRIATHTKNKWNREPQAVAAGRTSSYKGVFLDRTHGRFKSQIQCEGRRISLGYFSNPEDAASAYDAKARELHGEFARPNFPDAVQSCAEITRDNSQIVEKLATIRQRLKNADSFLTSLAA